MAIIILISLLLVVFVFLGLYAYRVRERQLAEEDFQKARSRTAAKLSVYREYISGFEHRLMLINRHAADYVNSLESDISERMMTLRRILDSQLSLSSSIEEKILHCEDPQSLAMREREVEALNSQTEEASAERPRSDSNLMLSLYQSHSISPQWESEFEENLQIVGKSIYEASRSYLASLGMPADADRQGAAQDLRQAGILGIENTIDENE